MFLPCDKRVDIVHIPYKSPANVHICAASQITQRYAETLLEARYFHHLQKESSYSPIFTSPKALATGISFLSLWICLCGHFL